MGASEASLRGRTTETNQQPAGTQPVDRSAGPNAPGTLPAKGTPPSFDAYPEVMDTAQVAEMLDYKATGIRTLAKEGRIPAHREPGTRRWWFDRDELIAWLRSETRVKPAE